MEIFVVAYVVTALLVMAGVLIKRNLRYKALATQGRWQAAIVSIILSVVLVCDLMAGEEVLARLPFDLLLSTVCLSMLTSSLIAGRAKVIIFSSAVICDVILVLYYLLCFADVMQEPDLVQIRRAGCMVSMAYIGVFLYSIWYRVRDIQALMQSASVWSWLTFSVDVFYLLAIVVLILIFQLFIDVPVIILMLCVLMTGLMLAYLNRINSDSAFALLHRHERAIVESMKISSVDASASSPGEENMYREVFERVQKYFEEEKPFLRGNLTINDVVAEVFSNKVYISRAISHFTGRNFCQYVNYHRVMYAMDCYRANPALKVSELWPLCGFNTIVSFNMAFRLFMNENPSDWCRKEKMRLLRKRK